MLSAVCCRYIVNENFSKQKMPKPMCITNIIYCGLANEMVRPFRLWPIVPTYRKSQTGSHHSAKNSDFGCL